jgi:hypothetical protein
MEKIIRWATVVGIALVAAIVILPLIYPGYWAQIVVTVCFAAIVGLAILAVALGSR